MPRYVAYINATVVSLIIFAVAFMIPLTTASAQQPEYRYLPSVSPLNVALVSDAVAQAEQIRRAAAEDTIAIVYPSDSMTTTGFVDLLATVAAAHNAARIGHLGIVAHGCPGGHDLGKGEDLSLATMPSQAAAMERLRSLLTNDTRVDLYPCSVADGAGGKAFVDELSAATDSAVFAGDNPVGTVPGADFVWEYHTWQAAASNELLALQEMETIPLLLLTTSYSISPNKATPTISSVSPAQPVATGAA